jgi:hypothetical protein
MNRSPAFNPQVLPLLEAAQDFAELKANYPAQKTLPPLRAWLAAHKDGDQSSAALRSALSLLREGAGACARYEQKHHLVCRATEEAHRLSRSWNEALALAQNPASKPFREQVAQVAAVYELLKSAESGSDRDDVQALTCRLCREHLSIPGEGLEMAWDSLVAVTHPSGATKLVPRSEVFIQWNTKEKSPLEHNPKDSNAIDEVTVQRYGVGRDKKIAYFWASGSFGWVKVEPTPRTRAAQQFNASLGKVEGASWSAAALVEMEQACRPHRTALGQRWPRVQALAEAARRWPSLFREV